MQCRADSFVNTEKEEDPTTHEVKYTTSVGSIEEAGGKSLLMNASPQMAQDVRAAFAAVPRVKPTWTERHLKIMVVGESGLGKCVPLYFACPDIWSSSLHLNALPQNSTGCVCYHFLHCLNSNRFD